MVLNNWMVSLSNLFEIFFEKDEIFLEIITIYSWKFFINKKKKSLFLT